MNNIAQMHGDTIQPCIRNLSEETKKCIEESTSSRPNSPEVTGYSPLSTQSVDGFIRTDNPSTTVLSFNKLIIKVKELRFTHNQAQKYYEKRRKYIMWPSIILTSLTGSLSFISTQFPNEEKLLNIFIGVIGSLSSLLVALGAAYKFDSKAESHAVSAESYNRLLSDLFFKGLKHRDNIKEEELLDFFEKTQEKVNDISQRCKYLIPTHIENDYKNKKHTFHRNSMQRNLETMIITHKYNKKIQEIEEGKDVNSDISIV